MGRLAGELVYQITADSKQFVKSIEGANKQFGQLGKTLTAGGKALTAGLTVPLVAAGAGILKLAADAGKAADRILDLEQITGLSTDTLQEFKNVAVVAGVDFEGLVGSLTRFQGRLREIDKEGGRSAEAVARLGISIRDTNGQVRAADDIFPEFLDALSGIDNITERNALAQDIFGRSLQDLAPVLALTGDQLRAARNEAKELGLVQSRESLEAANNYRIALDKLKLSIQGQALAIGSELAPALEGLVPLVSDVASSVLNIVKGFSQLDVDAQKTILVLGGLAAAVGPILVVVGKVTAALPALKAGLVAVKGAAVLLTGPVGVVAAGILAIGAAAVVVVGNVRALSRAKRDLDDALSGEAGLDTLIRGLEEAQSQANIFSGELEKAANQERENIQLGNFIRARAFEEQKIYWQAQLRAGNANIAKIKEQIAAIEAQAEAERKAAAEEAARLDAEAKALVQQAQANQLAEDERQRKQEFINTLRRIDELQQSGAISEIEALERKIKLREQEVEAIKQAAIAGLITSKAAKTSIDDQIANIDRYKQALDKTKESGDDVAESVDEITSSSKALAGTIEDIATVSLSVLDASLFSVVSTIDLVASSSKNLSENLLKAAADAAKAGAEISKVIGAASGGGFELIAAKFSGGFGIAATVISVTDGIVKIVKKFEEANERINKTIEDSSNDASRIILENQIKTLDQQTEIQRKALDDRLKAERELTTGTLREIDKRLQAELEAAGLADKSRVERLTEDLAKAQVIGDRVKAFTLAQELEKAKIVEKYEDEKRAERERSAAAEAKIANDRAKLEREFALQRAQFDFEKAAFEKQLQIAQINIARERALADIPWFDFASKNKVNNSYAKILASVAALQLPSVPRFANGVKNFMVPQGYPRDSFPMLVQSGERVTVETPQQQAGKGSDGLTLQVGTLVADDAGLRHLRRELERVKLSIGG